MAHQRFAISNLAPLTATYSYNPDFLDSLPNHASRRHHGSHWQK